MSFLEAASPAEGVSIFDPTAAEPRAKQSQRCRPHALALCVSLVAALAGCQSGKTPAPAPDKPAASSEKAPTPAVDSAAPVTDKAALDPAAAEKAAAAKAAAEKTAAERPRLREPVFQKVQAKPVAEVKPTPGDPVQGKFSLDDALKGLPGKGKTLFADLTTS